MDKGGMVWYEQPVVFGCALVSFWPTGGTASTAVVPSFLSKCDLPEPPSQKKKKKRLSPFRWVLFR